MFIFVLFGCINNNNQPVSGTNYGNGNFQQTVQGPETVTNVLPEVETGSINSDVEKKSASEPPELIRFPVTAGHPWSSSIITITEGVAFNEIIINSSERLIDADGITFTGLSNLRGKTIILHFANTEASNFSRARMFKLGKSDKKAILPLNAIPIDEEYIPTQNTEPGKGIEFEIPADFDGQLDFIFYQAKLNDLKITAYYK